MIFVRIIYHHVKNLTYFLPNKFIRRFKQFSITTENNNNKILKKKQNFIWLTTLGTKLVGQYTHLIKSNGENDSDKTI